MLLALEYIEKYGKWWSIRTNIILINKSYYIDRMFEAIVEKILNRILHEYVEGFNSENLKIGLWSG